jgi:hypothetical protein
VGFESREQRRLAKVFHLLGYRKVPAVSSQKVKGAVLNACGEKSLWKHSFPKMKA